MPVKVTYHVSGKITDAQQDAVNRLEAAYYSEELLGLPMGVFRVMGITKSFNPRKYDIELVSVVSTTINPDEPPGLILYDQAPRS